MSRHGTGIQWTHAEGHGGETWNPVTGCSKVSAGCAHCYAETVARRFPATFTDDGEFRPWTPENVAHNVLLHPGRLSQPIRWTRPRMIFVNSMSDLFHEAVPLEYIAAVFGVMAAAPQHTFQILTKRPDRARAFFDWHATRVRDADVRWEPWKVCEDEAMNLVEDLPAIGQQSAWPLANVWLGVTIENRRTVSRADTLRTLPAAVRFISAEPLLGPVISRTEDHLRDGRSEIWHRWPDGYGAPGLTLYGIDWVIAGGESGTGARRMDPDWARDLRDACAEQGTAFFVKQLGSVLAGKRGARGKGGELDDLPEDLRIRQMPGTFHVERGSEKTPTNTDTLNT